MKAAALERERRIFEVVHRIPKGCVATYGQVAMLADLPRGHRQVARALKNCDPAAPVPWHRVVGKRSRTRARIAVLDDATFGEQRRRLVGEGVVVAEDGSIHLGRFGWLPLY